MFQYKHHTGIKLQVYGVKNTVMKTHKAFYFCVTCTKKVKVASVGQDIIPTTTASYALFTNNGLRCLLTSVQ